MRPLAASCLLLLVTCSQLVEPRPSPFGQIPGLGALSSLSSSAINTVSKFIDSSLDRVAEPLTNCIAGSLSCLASSDDRAKDPDTNRNVSQIIQSRGFQAEEYDVVTRDGYILTIQRIVNPLVTDKSTLIRPVIMQHGLMSSSVDWVINSVTVRPSAWPRNTTDNDTARDLPKDPTLMQGDSQEHPNSLGFYLANQGYDVFLANSRGNIYGQRHLNMSSWEPKFWDFTFDHQVTYDLPDIIEFVQKLTGKTKVGYVGHSQGTAMIFGLLSDRPEYADIVEPVITLAPVAFVNHSISPVKYFAVYTPVFQHINMWFATSNAAVKYLAPIVCGPKVVRKEICANILFLSVGFDEAELDDSRIDAYLSHMPSGTSVKNIAHYGQMVLSGRFAHFDYGILGNQIHYHQIKAPDYPLENIRSKSLVLFTAENDWLASPKDVDRLKRTLRVEPYAVHNITESMPQWNHIDFLYGKHCGLLVNTKVHQAFKHFCEMQ